MSKGLQKEVMFPQASSRLRVGLAFIAAFSIFTGSSTSPLSASSEWDDLKPEATTRLAFTKVNDFLESQPSLSVTPILYISENALKRDYQIKLTGLDKVSRLWSRFVQPSELKVVLFTEKDGEWVDAKQAELLGKWMSSSEPQSERIKQYGCNIGGMYLPGVLFLCVKEKGLSPADSAFYGEAHTFAHEYTHFMEMNVKNWIGHATDSGIGKRNSCWIEEGFASFYGLAVGSYPLSFSQELHTKFLRGQTHSYDNRRGRPAGTLARELALGDVENFKKLMEMLENTPFPCEETQNAYAFGAAAAEMLVAVKGQEAMNNFYQHSAASGDWRESFEKAFGIPVSSFYEKLSAYVTSQFRLEFAESQKTDPIPTPTPVESSSATPVPSPTSIAPAPVAKKRTITCVKGKTTKKVTGKNPKCPKGYKKKKK